ncbi:MAG: glucan 1,4-alpha-glucosidase, partial [Chloroflexi bacterium]|nr:glucan 1,4-alpha-glucosidase [Chloroflexota bacterium]
FEYSDLKIAPGEVPAGQPVTVTATVTNTGEREGDEIVQLYVTDREASVPVPVRQLAGFLRVHLQPGEARTISFTVLPDQLAVFLDDGRRVVEPGAFEVAVGGKQPGAGGGADAPTTTVVSGQFTVTGDLFEVETFRT